MPRTNAYPTLTRGDLLLTKGSFDTGTHAVINIGQALFSHSRHGNYDFCHAAIYVGRGGAKGNTHFVAEAVGGGVSVNEMEGGHTYVVFRYKDSGLAEVAAQTAWNWAMPMSGDDRMKYNFGRLVSSVFSTSGLGFFGKKRVANLATQIDKRGAPKNSFGATKSMICSEFAISVWNAAGFAKKGEYPIKADPTSCTPKELSNKLRSSPEWEEFEPLDFSQPAQADRDVLPTGMPETRARSR
jgi:hypothetical protein